VNEMHAKCQSSFKSPYKCQGLMLRPYQLLCVVCSLVQKGPSAKKISDILEAVRKNPDMPITLQCNIGDVYVYQDPGHDDDTPEGTEYNLKRDLDILQKLDLSPGTTLPARTLLIRLMRKIKTALGICGYTALTSDAWKGCPRAKSGDYEKGVEKGIRAIIPPRNDDEMMVEKRKSAEEIYRSSNISVRPHVIMCAVGHYGMGEIMPNKGHNVVEFIDVIRKKPEVTVTLTKGADWMICAPCPARVPELSGCVHVQGCCGLSNEWRDLNVLQATGLTYGTTMNAREFLRLLFDRIPTTEKVCRKDNPVHSVWWDHCSVYDEQDYSRGREMLMNELKLTSASENNER